MPTTTAMIIRTTIQTIVLQPELRVSRQPSPLLRDNKPITNASTIIAISISMPTEVYKMKPVPRLIAEGTVKSKEFWFRRGEAASL
jgi:hypothetical protein